jgi:hypothetical protein
VVNLGVDQVEGAGLGLVVIDVVDGCLLGLSRGVDVAGLILEALSYGSGSTLRVRDQARLRVVVRILNLALFGLIGIVGSGLADRERVLRSFERTPERRNLAGRFVVVAGTAVPRLVVKRQLDLCSTVAIGVVLSRAPIGNGPLLLRCLVLSLRDRVVVSVVLSELSGGDLFELVPVGFADGQLALIETLLRFVEGIVFGRLLNIDPLERLGQLIVKRLLGRCSPVLPGLELIVKRLLLVVSPFLAFLVRLVFGFLLFGQSIDGQLIGRVRCVLALGDVVASA